MSIKDKIKLFELRGIPNFRTSLRKDSPTSRKVPNDLEKLEEGYQQKDSEDLLKFHKKATKKEEIFMRESLIFSRQWKKEDIDKIVQFEENNNELSLQNENDIYDGVDNKIINFEEYKDVMDEISSVFSQKDMELLYDDITLILEYFYLRETIVEQYICDKYKNNDNQRHLNLRLADYAIRIQFEENVAIKKITKLINQLISGINVEYIDTKNLDDLSDITYMNKLEGVLGTKEIPKFLLREGFRIRRNLLKNKDYIKKAIINEKKERKTVQKAYNHIQNLENKCDNNVQDKENNIKINNDYNVQNIVEEIEIKKRKPFERKLKEVYIIFFILSIKEMKDENLILKIKLNFKIVSNYFELDSYKDYTKFIEKYINYKKEDLKPELFEMEFCSINKSEFLCKYILASYYSLISKIFNNNNKIYLNLLLFLQNYISEKNKILIKIIENEVNSILNGPNISINVNDILVNAFNNFKNTKLFSFLKASIDVIQEINKLQQQKEKCLEKKYNEEKYYEGKYHVTKYLDLNSIKNIFNAIINKKLKDRFYEVIKDEESFEIGSNVLKNNIIGFFKKCFRMEKSENDDTIKKHLKLIPYTKGKFEEQTILILISGWLSSKDNHYEQWDNFIKVYKNRFKNPIIYFYNWPGSSKRLKNLVFFPKDFRDARERAKYCGQLLALMIISKKIFDGFKINLAAFSLGNHVLKNCLKELEKFGKTDFINNIIFMAGATDIKCNFKWEHILGSVNGIIANFYSEYDLALWVCKKITKKDTIGSKKLKFKNVNIKNYLFSCFHLLYRLNMGTLGEIVINDLKE